MPHISKRRLTKEDFKKLYKNFLHSLGKLGNQGAVDRFYWQFLTPTEKVMLSKRLAIILLIDRGYQTYDIVRSLQVSSSTVDRIGKLIDRGAYFDVISLLRENESNLSKFFKALFDIMSMPPYHMSRENFIKAKFKKGS